MIYGIRTVTGSLYEVDFKKRIWRRKMDDLGTMIVGSFMSCSMPKEGQKMCLICPPYPGHKGTRMILTPIVATVITYGDD